MEFKRYIGGKSAWMKRIAKANKGCDHKLSNKTFCSDICLIRVKKVEEANADGVGYCGPVKTIHKGFFLAAFEKSMKYWPVGYILVMKTATRFPVDKPLIDI